MYGYGRYSPILTPGGEQSFASDQAAPSAVTDAHVFGIAPEMPSCYYRYLQVLCRFTATAGDAECTVIVHFYDKDTAQFYATAEFTVAHTPSSTVGRVLLLDGQPGASHMAFQVTGVNDGDTAVFVVRGVLT